MALLPLWPSPRSAQQVEADGCRAARALPPPGGSADAAFDRCRLDEAPRLLSDVDHLPGPLYRRQEQAELIVFVGRDGRVDAGQTTYLAPPLDTLFAREVLDGVASLRFEVGHLDGRAVPYGFVLSVRTGERADTVPERLTWRYVGTPETDSLLGTWERVPPEGPLTAELFAEAARSVTRRLRDMQVLLPEIPFITYCLVVDRDYETVLQAVETELAFGHQPLAPPGCERDVSHLRYRLETPVATGGGRTVVRASGDHLARWPRGLDGRSWRSWQAYCVVPERAPTACEVEPVLSADPVLDGMAGEVLPGPVDGTAPVEVAVEVTATEAYRMDTVRAAVPDVPVLQQRAIVDVRPRMCERRATWSAFADRPGGGERVVFLRLPSDVWPSGYAVLTDVRRPAAGRPLMGMTCATAPSEERIALFVLGGVGEPAAGPVRFCLNEPDCAQSYVIDPDRHELAPDAHVRFRLGELRPEAVSGGDLQFRVRLDRVSDGLMVLAVVAADERSGAWLLQRSGDRTYDFGGLSGLELSPDTEVLVYLVRDEESGL